MEVIILHVIDFDLRTLLKLKSDWINQPKEVERVQFALDNFAKHNAVLELSAVNWNGHLFVKDSEILF